MPITLALRSLRSLKANVGYILRPCFFKKKQLWSFRLYLGPSLSPPPPRMLIQGKHLSGPPLGIEFWVKGRELCQVLAKKA